MVTGLLSRVAALLAAALTVCIVAGAGGMSRAAAEGRAGGPRERPTVALALGGGSARGFSHIGLLQALYEEGVPVDYIVGTSMGSVVGGLHAAGFSVDNLVYLATHTDLGELFEPLVPPRGGLIGTERFERFLDALLLGLTLDETVISYHSVATNLQTGEEALLGSGPVPVSRAILASMAIPGIFPPVEIDGEYYVDGGVVSLVPVRAARDLGADVVIAVDVRRTLEPVKPDDLAAVLDLTLDHLLTANVEVQIDLADVVVRPELESDSYMDYDEAEAFIAEGYRAAREAMPAIMEALAAAGVPVPADPAVPSFGLSQGALEARLDRAIAAADGTVRWVRMSPPVEVEVRRHHPPIVRVGFDVPVGRWGRGYPIHGFYSRERSAGGWVNTFGLGTGDCGTVCAGLFGRLQEQDDKLHAGLLVQGEPGHRFRYRFEWEHRPSLSAAWHLHLTAPVPRGWSIPPSDFQLRVGQDPRGLYGRIHETVRAEALYRLYATPGSTRKVGGVLRASPSWYVGAGVGATFDDSPTLTPIGELGVVAVGRLFGLVPVRSRIALVYSGGRDPWSLRWTLVE